MTSTQNASSYVCRICGRQAIGVHYRVLTCGGCKTFYWRTVVNQTTYYCRGAGDCSTEADETDRVRCKACRFAKCISLGMSMRGKGTPLALASSGKLGSPPHHGKYRKPREGIKSEQETRNHLLGVGSNPKGGRTVASSPLDNSSDIPTMESSAANQERSITHYLRFALYDEPARALEGLPMVTYREESTDSVLAYSTLVPDLDYEFSPSDWPAPVLSHGNEERHLAQEHKYSQLLPWLANRKVDADLDNELAYSTFLPDYEFSSDHSRSPTPALSDYSEERQLPTDSMQEYEQLALSDLLDGIATTDDLNKTDIPSQCRGESHCFKCEIFLSHGTEGLERGIRTISASISEVAAVVDDIFGDQISSWAACRERARQYGKVVDAPETCVEEMLMANRNHVADFGLRQVRFAEVIPGSCQLDRTTITGCVGPGWKKMVYWTIHHAAFMTDDDSYITLGPRQLHYSRDWIQNLYEAPVYRLMKIVGKQFRAIGLGQIERYLLMIVVMFELDDQREDTMVKAIHRHYVDVLLNVLKWRCSDGDQLRFICRQLEQFFCAFKVLDCIYRSYAGNYARYHALRA